MSTPRIVGIVCLVLGIGLWITGINASESAADRWSNFFTGHFTDKTTWTILGGVGLAVFGLFSLIFGGRGKTA